MNRYTGALLAIAGVAAGNVAHAQSWNLYSGTTTYSVPYYAVNPTTGRFDQITMSQDQAAGVLLSLNNGPVGVFTMDTGSTGIIGNRNNFPTAGLTSLGPGQQFYDSSGVVLQGNYYLTNVGIYQNTPTGTQLITTASVVALQATNQTCAFTNKGCTPNANPTPAYMGIGFDRGVSAITPPAGSNINPFININGGASYSQGYIVTNSGVQLGLTNASTANYAFVKLMPNPTPAGQVSAAWLQAPMTIAVGGVVGTGNILPDSGINYAFLTAPPGASLSTTACPNPPGGNNCVANAVPIQVYLPGQSTPQVAFYNFTTSNGGGNGGNALQPYVTQVVPGSSVFLNTGREFFAGFNYFYDPVNGYVGYRWNGQVPSQFGAVIPIVALQGNVSLPASLSSSFPTYLMSPVTVSSTGTAVFQGNLFGPGSLTAAGGDISLAGTANTYTGGTFVNAGSLSLGPGASLPASSALTMNGGTFNLNGNSQVLGSLAGNGGTLNLNGGLMVLNSALSNQLGSTLTGNGSFTVQGGGSLNYTGNGTGFTGSTVVNNASLSVNGTLGGNVFTGANGTIGGGGAIVGNLYNGGVLSPGNSVGTLTVNGNFFNTGGLMSVEVMPAGLGDQLMVNGAATLQGGSVYVFATPGVVYGPTQTYRIISTTGGLTGAFASVNELYPFLQSSLSYDANNAYLTLQLGGFAAAAATPTQAAVGAVLDANVGNASGDFANVLSALAVNTTSTAQGQAALQALSGNNYAGFSSSMVQGAALFMNNFSGTVGGGAFGGAQRVALAEACETGCDAAQPTLWGAWGGALGGLGTIGATAPVGGVTYNAGGFAAGLDRAVSDSLRLGVTAGYTAGTQWVSGFSGVGRTDTVLAGLYGNYARGPVYADGLLGYAYSGNQMWRQILLPGLSPRTALGQTGANQWYGQVEGGYRFEIDGGFGAYVTPFARLQGYTGTQNAFTETGAQSLNLTIAQQTTNSLRSVLGATVGGAVDLGWREKLALQFRLGWSHEYADTARPVSATLAGAPAMPFTTWGIAPTRDGALLGFGASTAIAEATSVYLRYEGTVAGQDSAHALTAGLRMTW